MQRIKSKQKGFSELRKRRSIKEISLFLAEQGNITQAIEIIKEINIKHLIVNLLSKISLIIASQGKHEKAMLTIQQSIQLAEEINDDYDKCNSFIDISLILFKLGNVEQTELLIKQAITIADNINDLSDKCNAFINISLNIAEQESIEDAKLLMNKAHEFAKQIDFSRHKNFALANIAINMSKQGNYEDAIKIVKEIDAADQCIALSGISKGLLKENNIDHANQVMQQAITSANVISNILEKIEAYKYIALILIEQDKHTMAFDITRKIEFVRERIELWQEIGGKIFVDKGAKYCLALLNNLPNEEAILFYKKGIVSSIPINETTEQLVLELLPHIMQDLDSLEILLQNHALYCLFFRTNQSKYTKQLFKTIDIQWAETIANCLTEENHNKKLSTNLSVWLHEIPDEEIGRAHV